jgi:hypothetical protein
MLNAVKLKKIFSIAAKNFSFIFPKQQYKNNKYIELYRPSDFKLFFWLKKETFKKTKFLKFFEKISLRH